MINKSFKKRKGATVHEMAAEALCFGYYVLVLCGEGYTSSSGIQVLDMISSEKSFRDLGYKSGKQLNTAALLEEDEELFHGVWGRVYNRYANARASNISETISKWNSKIFQDADPRFLESTKTKKSEDEENKPPKKLPQRFFLITTNMDNDASKAGFREKEYYEMNGNAYQWQCRTPCTKDAWTVDEEFRFETDRKTGRAPSVKYAEKSAEMLQEEQVILQTHRLKHNMNEMYYVGDEDTFNPHDPFGRFEFLKSHIQKPKKISRSEVDDLLAIAEYKNESNSLTEEDSTREEKRKELRRNIMLEERSEIQRRGAISKVVAEKRAMYFRYFTSSDIATRVYDGHRLKNSQSQVFVQRFAMKNVLRQTNPGIELINASGERYDAALIRHNFINFETGVEERGENDMERKALLDRAMKLVEKNHVKPKAGMMDSIAMNDGDDDDVDDDTEEYNIEEIQDMGYEKNNEEEIEKRKKQIQEHVTKFEARKKGSPLEREHLFQFDPDEHDSTHKVAFGGGVSPGEAENGSVDIIVVDGMIHHDIYYTKVPNIVGTEDNYKIIQGSDSSFYVSLQIKDVSPSLQTRPTMKYFFGEIKPNVRRRRPSDGTYIDCIILDMQKFSAIPEENEIPFAGQISLVVEPVRPRRKITRPAGNSGHVFRSGEDVWQLLGKYDIVELKYHTDDEGININRKRGQNAENDEEDSFGTSFEDDGYDRSDNESPEAMGIITSEGIRTTKSKHIVDFVLRDVTHSHGIVLRTVEHEDFSHEIVNIFIDLPVSVYDPDRQSQYHSSMMNTNMGDNSQQLDRSPQATFGMTNGNHVTQSLYRTGTRITTMPNPVPTPMPPATPLTPSLIPPLQSFLTVRDIIEDEYLVDKIPDTENQNKRPLINRVMCRHCHSLARPRVKMGLGDKAWVRTPMKKFKAWSQMTTKSVKEKSEFPLVILELGGEAKLRKQTDLLMKQTKLYGTVLIRINPQGIKEKKKKRSAVDEKPEEDDQVILIEESCPAAIEKIDQHIWGFFAHMMSKDHFDPNYFHDLKRV